VRTPIVQLLWEGDLEMSSSGRIRFLFESARSRESAGRLPRRMAGGATGAIRLAALAACLTVVASAPAALPAELAAGGCTTSPTLLKSPRAGSREVQAKAINDRGDIVGFADSRGGSGPIHAILWKDGKASHAVDLGVLPGYVASEAYGVNDDRIVFGVLYDRRDRAFPFRWQAGRMTLLKSPTGRLRPIEPSQRNAINASGEIVATMMVGDTPHAVRWAPDGKASFLPGLPGHAWTWAFSINDDGIVSGWSREQPNRDWEENPVLWTSSGDVVALQTVPGQSDGIAEATNSSGLTVGYLGNQSDSEPEFDQLAVWETQTAEPQLIGPKRDWLIAEFVDVNDQGQAIGHRGVLDPDNGFVRGNALVWQTGWTAVRPLPVPAASRVNPVRVTQVNDVNNHGAIIGNVFGLAAADFGALRRIDPVLWACAFTG
jgi:probable HAF family extracellular repeat protein